MTSPNPMALEAKALEASRTTTGQDEFLQKNAAETSRLITKALAKASPVLGGPEGDSILAYSIPSGLWLMLQANVRNLLDKLAALPLPAAGEGLEPAWQEDPAADERWNAGCDFAILQLCALLGVDPKSFAWDAATETLDGDVCAVIGRIFQLRYGEDFDFHAATPAARAAVLEPIDPERYALGLLAEEFGEVLQWIGKSLRFGYDTPGRRDPLSGDVTGETPRDLMPPELGDVLAAIEFAVAHGMVNSDAMTRQKAIKLAKLLNPEATDNLGRPLAPQPAALKEKT